MLFMFSMMFNFSLVKSFAVFIWEKSLHFPQGDTLDEVVDLEYLFFKR